VLGTLTGMETRARYDGFADWYDANIGAFAAPAGGELLELGNVRDAFSTWPTARLTSVGACD
jgi:hypothetical protein